MPLPDCADGTDPSLSTGTGSENEAELGLCAVTYESGNYGQPNPCPWLTPPTDPGDGSPAMGGGPTAQPPMTNLPIVRASGAREASNVPLGQTMCKDWNAAQSDSNRQTLIERIRAFVGGSINDATTKLGHGPQLSDLQTARLFDYWCGYGYAQNFLLYKLYSFSADFQSLAGTIGQVGAKTN
jgi:hypothetical protein